MNTHRTTIYFISKTFPRKSFYYHTFHASSTQLNKMQYTQIYFQLKEIHKLCYIFIYNMYIFNHILHVNYTLYDKII